MYQKGEVKDPIKLIALIFLTCGLYSLYYLYYLMEDINKAQGKEIYDPKKELLLVVVSCGLWNYWLQWRLSESVAKIEDEWGTKHFLEPIVLFIGNVFLGGALSQIALNEVWTNGKCPGVESLENGAKEPLYAEESVEDPLQHS